MVISQNGWFITENPSINGWWTGLPSIFGNPHIHIYPQKETDYTYGENKKRCAWNSLTFTPWYTAAFRRDSRVRVEPCVCYENEGDAWQTKRSCGFFLNETPTKSTNLVDLDSGTGWSSPSPVVNLHEDQIDRGVRIVHTFFHGSIGDLPGRDWDNAGVGNGHPNQSYVLIINLG